MIGLLFLAEAAAAPVAGPVEHLRTVVVDAIRNCPRGEDGEVVVCAPDRGIAEGYRIPRLDPRFAGGALRPSGRGEAADAAIGAVGTGSCSTVGASGSTGCGLAEANAWGRWKKQQQAEGASFPW